LQVSISFGNSSCRCFKSTSILAHALSILFRT